MATQYVDWPCILCQRPTRNRGVFIPDKPNALSLKLGAGLVPANRERIVLYALCDRHEFCPETAEAVERAMETRRLDGLIDMGTTAPVSSN